MTMRTTVTLDEDVAAALDEVRASESIGVSEAVNLLARQGAAARRAPTRDRVPFRQRTASIGLRVDVTNIGEVLDVLDEDDRSR